uniref:Uncharacterized protein n=1 Tax=Pyrodinium bahamense TaxID=73915 RepID=A0A7R9ZYV5_9DINO|mmetsp:Transcript_15419/g.42462  ORF Transcript_15419/g.42462 Transcript_15419/m.42462 type:complete len:155 (+) Transcript_15419:80-544(+)
MGSDGGEKSNSLAARVIGMIRRKAAAMGTSALIGYLLIDMVVYAIALVLAREAFLRSTGKEPWQDARGFLLVVGGIWAGNNATRPMRLAGAAALAPLVEWLLVRLEGLLPTNVQKKALPGGILLATPLAAGALLCSWGLVVLMAMFVYVSFRRG